MKNSNLAKYLDDNFDRINYQHLQALARLYVEIMRCNAVEHNVLAYGEALQKFGLDDRVNGGFWVWDCGDLEFYSIKFRSALGFSDENDFPNVAASWQNQIFPEDLETAIDNFNKHKSNPDEYPYYQRVRYRHKRGPTVSLVCAGTLVGEKLMLGTHEILPSEF